MPSSAVRTPSAALSVWARLLMVVSLLAASLLVAAPAEADAALRAPSGLKATASASTSLTVTWKKVSKAPRYRVQYSTSSTMKAPTYKHVRLMLPRERRTR